MVHLNPLIIIGFKRSTFFLTWNMNEMLFQSAYEKLKVEGASGRPSLKLDEHDTV